MPVAVGRDLDVTKKAERHLGRHRPRNPAIIRVRHEVGPAPRDIATFRRTRIPEGIPGDVDTPEERARRTVVHPRRLSIVPGPIVGAGADRPCHSIPWTPDTDALAGPALPG